MFEKFKDLLYEASDVLLAFVIILVMSTVITWKVSDSLAFSTDKPAPGESAAAQQNSKSNEDLSEEPPTNVSSENSPVNQVPSDKEPVEPQTPPVLETVVTAVTPQPQPTMIQVEIPNGTPGSGIANILKQKGLIDNSAKFIARIQELKLEAKLKSGKFSVPSNASLDDVIYTITGTKKSS